MKIKIILSIIIIAIVWLSIVGCGLIKSIGREPQGEIIEKIESSPNYRDGQFHNHTPRAPRTGNKSSHIKRYWNWLFGKRDKGLRPNQAIPSIKTILKEIPQNEDVMVWFGHSSVFIQIDSVRFLLDPVLISGAPVPGANRAFKGTKVFKPNDIPDIDYLLISHDHWDHLDYKTIKKMRKRIGKVICGLGTGEHFRRWDFDNKDIIELDWNEKIEFDNNIDIYVLPSRHYSGRADFGTSKTLWCSFMIKTKTKNIFISGDTGYDKHFANISKQFPNIDLAIVEFGQYGVNWSDIHIMPDDIKKVINDLNPQKSFLFHNGKFALGRHPWQEPFEIITQLIEKEGFNIITPMLGEIVYLNDDTQKFSKWWEGMN